MATASSVDSSLDSSSFFAADWLSPLDFIRSLVGLECKEDSVEAPMLVEKGCHEQVPAVTSDLIADTECLFQEAEQDLLEIVAAELRQEEEFLQNLLRGPSGMNQFDDEAPRQDRFSIPNKCMNDCSKLDLCFGPGWQSRFQQAEEELVETVAAELRQEEEFCQNLLRGPPAVSQFDEAPPKDKAFQKAAAVTNQTSEDAFSEITRYLARRREEDSSMTQSKATLTKDALRQQAKETLSDGFATGCLALAFAKLKLSRESPEMTSLRQLTQETLCESATNGSLKAALAKVKHARIWGPFGRSLDLASKREEVRQEVRAGAAVEAELPIEQPKATVDVEDLCGELVILDHSGLKELPSPKTNDLKAAMQIEAAPTKSKQLAEDDADQRHASPNGFVPARMIATSPMKGKKRSSPKKGGS